MKISLRMVVVAAIAVLGLCVALAFAGDPVEGKASGHPCAHKEGKPCDPAGCPMADAKDSTGYAAPLKNGDKYACGGCAEEGTVAAETTHVEKDGKHHYFCCEHCKAKWEKKTAPKQG